MIFTNAKALVRSFFYLEFLPSRLPLYLLRGGIHLVLLGDSQEEESLLEDLGIPAERVFSIEKDHKIFSAQSLRARKGDLKVGLYHGELIEFITHYLKTNQRLQVMNLDICGHYRTAIDPVMTPILLFTRRNPSTVVATYSNVGRDLSQLVEGMKSLAIFRWLAPEATEAAVDQLYGRYLAVGLKPDICFNMVLRHLFWLRSHMEHIVLGRVTMGYLAREKAEALFAEHAALWEQAWSKVRLPLSYQDWMAGIDAFPKTRRKPMYWDVRLDDVTLATYDADGGWKHTGWFTTYSHVAPMSQNEWLVQALSAITAQPLRYAARDSVTLGSYGSEESVPAELVIWNRDGRLPACRVLPIPEVSYELAVLDVVATSPALTDADDEGDIIDIIPLIRELALQGLNTKQVRERIHGLPGAEVITDRSITALIARSPVRAKANAKSS